LFLFLFIFAVVVAASAAAAGGALSRMGPRAAATAATAPDVPGEGGGGRRGGREGGREAPVFDEGFLYLFVGGLAEDADRDEICKDVAIIVILSCFD